MFKISEDNTRLTTMCYNRICIEICQSVLHTVNVKVKRTMFTNCVKLHLLKSIKYRPLFKWNMSQKLNTNELRIYFLNVMVAISYDMEFGRVFFIWQAFDIICINVISKWVKDPLNPEKGFDYRKKVFCNALNIFPMFVFLVSFNYQMLKKFMFIFI